MSDDRRVPNTYTTLQYHVIFSTKNREPSLAPRIAAVHEYLGGCIRRLEAVPLQIGGIDDHVHILLRLKPTHCLADVLREIKRGSSEWLRKSIRGFRWQDGYSAFTVSASQIARVRRYIETQAEHHARTNFAEELRALLVRHGTDYDERYLL